MLQIPNNNFGISIGRSLLQRKDLFLRKTDPRAIMRHRKIIKSGMQRNFRSFTRIPDNIPLVFYQFVDTTAHRLHSLTQKVRERR